MPFRISGKNIDIGETLRERVNQRITEAAGEVFRCRRRVFQDAA